jgi:predicted DNA-binding antitoxin AbrB/MazE fold protein
LSKVIKARYEKGMLKPLEPIELEEGEEVRIQLLPDEFPDLLDKVDAEANGDIDKALREARERWKRWY